MVPCYRKQIWEKNEEKQNFWKKNTLKDGGSFLKKTDLEKNGEKQNFRKKDKKYLKRK